MRRFISAIGLMALAVSLTAATHAQAASPRWPPAADQPADQPAEQASTDFPPVAMVATIADSLAANYQRKFQVGLCLFTIPNGDTAVIVGAVAPRQTLEVRDGWYGPVEFDCGPGTAVLRTHPDSLCRTDGSDCRYLTVDQRRRATKGELDHLVRAGAPWGIIQYGPRDFHGYRVARSRKPLYTPTSYTATPMRDERLAAVPESIVVRDSGSKTADQLRAEVRALERSGVHRKFTRQLRAMIDSLEDFDRRIDSLERKAQRARRGISNLDEDQRVPRDSLQPPLASALPERAPRPESRFEWPPRSPARHGLFAVAASGAAGYAAGLIDRDRGGYRDSFVPGPDKQAHFLGHVIACRELTDRAGPFWGPVAGLAIGFGLEWGQGRRGGYSSWMYDGAYDVGGCSAGFAWSARGRSAITRGAGRTWRALRGQ